MKNTGLLEGKRPGDYLAGFGNGFATTALIHNGDWRPYLSLSEKQHSVYFDSMACVTFSALNQIEAILNYKLANNLIHKEDFDWLARNGYFNAEGKLNFSDRFTAKMSGTTRNGNWLYKVGDSIRKDGLVPEVKWPYPREQRSPVFDWDDYYKQPPQELIDLGKEFLTRFKVNYEWVKSNDDAALRVSPLQVTLYAWGPVKEGIYQRVTKTRNHATVWGAREVLRRIEDHYAPHEKKIANDYILGPQAMRYIITNKLPNKETKDMVTLVKERDKDTVYQLGQDGLYHPIANEDFVLKLYGRWKDITVEEVEAIHPLKVGSMIGEYTWFAQFISKLFK